MAELRERVEQRKGEVGQLEAQYREEVKQAAAQGVVSGKDEALLGEIRSFGPELRDVWEPRIQEAIPLARDAAATYYSFVSHNWRGLLRELEPQARRIRRRYHDELAKAREQLAAIESERGDIAAAVRHFTAGAGVRPFTATDVSDNPEDLPLLTDEAWQRYYSVYPDERPDAA